MSEAVKLSWFEVRRAFDVGVSRSLFAIKEGLQLEEGRTDLGIERHILGAVGEMALAKWLSVYWEPCIGGLDTAVGDVAGRHVKSVTRPGLSLIVREHDPDPMPYVQAVLALPTVTLTGWITGKDAKVEEFWRAEDAVRRIHRAAFFVPTNRLRPMKELP